jgi:hypothetical protein
MENRKVKQVGDGTSEKSGAHKEMGSEGEYVANILYTCM